MKNTLKLEFENNRIVMDRTFAKKVEDTRSAEYKHLQEVRRDYPDFAVIVRTIKKNSNKETYKGLTYEYMENYILNHGNDAEVQKSLAEYRNLREIARAHGKGRGYPVIKHWFLENYPEIEEFGIAA